MHPQSSVLLNRGLLCQCFIHHFYIVMSLKAEAAPLEGCIASLGGAQQPGQSECSVNARPLNEWSDPNGFTHWVEAHPQQPQLRGTFLISESEATVTYRVTCVHRVTVICKRRMHEATFICAHFCFSASGVPLCPRHACSLFCCDFGSLRTTVVSAFPAWEPLERVNCPHQTGTPRGSVCLPK